MENLPVKFPVFEPGSVWLVGAGPGDPGLMSLAGLHALQTSDVIVYDALVGDDILKLARPEAQHVAATARPEAQHLLAATARPEVWGGARKGEGEGGCP